jgi:hypothetical protein
MKLNNSTQIVGLLLSIPLELKLIEFSPYAGLVLPVLMGAYLAKKALPKLKEKRNRKIAAAAIFAGAMLATPQVQAAVSFSLLLDATEKMVSTCIFNQVTGFNVATFIIFGSIRMFYMVPLSLEIAEWNKKRQHNQNFSEEV